MSSLKEAISQIHLEQEAAAQLALDTLAKQDKAYNVWKTGILGECESKSIALHADAGVELLLQEVNEEIFGGNGVISTFADKGHSMNPNIPYKHYFIGMKKTTLEVIQGSRRIRFSAGSTYKVSHFVHFNYETRKLEVTGSEKNISEVSASLIMDQLESVKKGLFRGYTFSPRVTYQKEAILYRSEGDDILVNLDHYRAKVAELLVNADLA